VINLFEKLGDINPIKYIIFSNNISAESKEKASKLNAKI